MQKLLGFLPDADPTTPGVLTDCVNFIPYEAGMCGAPSPATPSGVPALAAECQGATVVTKLDDTRRIFGGTATAIYELLAGAWSNVSAAAYTGGAESRWAFAQFGNTTLASNRSDSMQRSTGGIFAAVAGAPKAKVIYTVGTQVMALNTTEVTYGDSSDRWWCSATNDETSWTPSLTTLCATGRLVSAPGQITAGGRLGDYAIAYKDKAVYLGQFVGSPAIWDWTLIPGGDAGCIGQEAWCDVGGAHVFVGADNIWLFDGSRPVPIATGAVRQWFYDSASAQYLYKTKCVFDKIKNLVWIFFPTGSSSVCNKALVYHLLTKQWGLVDQTIQAALYYISAGSTIDQLTNVSATIDGVSIPFDSAYWLGGGKSLSIVNSSNQIQMMVGAAGASGFTTGDVGDDAGTSLLSRVRLRFAPGYTPSTASMVGYTKMNEGDGLTTASSVAISSGRFDVLQEARWHRAQFALTGDVRVLGATIDLQPMGEY